MASSFPFGVGPSPGISRARPGAVAAIRREGYSAGLLRAPWLVSGGALHRPRCGASTGSVGEIVCVPLCRSGFRVGLPVPAPRPRPRRPQCRYGTARGGHAAVCKTAMSRLDSDRRLCEQRYEYAVLRVFRHFRGAVDIGPNPPKTAPRGVLRLRRVPHGPCAAAARRAVGGAWLKRIRRSGAILCARFAMECHPGTLRRPPGSSVLSSGVATRDALNKTRRGCTRSSTTATPSPNPA